ncbi:MAG TPA: DEAD/DEAH box helicase family protein [Opitutaceae bacterium]
MSFCRTRIHKSVATAGSLHGDRFHTGDARPVIGMPSRAELERRANLRQHRIGSLQTTLNALPLPPTCFRFKSEEVEARPYQLHCLQAAVEALLAGRRRMLFEVAPGTGKTLTIAVLIKRWFQAAVFSRVLLLAKAFRGEL